MNKTEDQFPEKDNSDPMYDLLHKFTSGLKSHAEAGDKLADALEKKYDTGKDD